MDSLPVKRCTKCGVENLATSEYFYKDKSGRYGLSSICKICNKLRCKEYGEANRETLAANSRMWNAANSEKVLARTKAWRQANPDKTRQYARNKKAKRKQAPGTHTAQDVAKQFALQGGKCNWCGSKLKKSGKDKFHVDHRTALVLGGANGPENIVCSCPTCNLRKGKKTPLEFAGRLF